MKSVSFIPMLNHLLGRAGLTSMFNDQAKFSPSAAHKEFERQSTIVLHDSQRLGTYVSKDGKARMDARRNAYKLDALEAAALAPKGGKRRTPTTPQPYGFHVQYNKLAVVRELAAIMAARREASTKIN